MLNFAALPPEINSARMYVGPGSTSMRLAATAWNTMAAELRSTAVQYGSVISALTGEGWFGPSSTLMSTAVTPYVDWLTITATAAEQAGVQANAAAAAYESAFAMTVPPAVVAANRAQLSDLLATNLFGQNAAAIAAVEAQYAQMWAQDAAAMNGYATASNAATQLTPFSAPQSGTNANGVAQQATAEAQATSASAATNAPTPASGLLSQLQEIFAPGSNQDTTGLAGILNDISGSNGALLGSSLSNGSIANFTNGFTTSGLTNPTSMIDSVTAFTALSSSAANTAAAADAPGLTAGVGPAAALGRAVSAQTGQASLVGALSVPGGWSASGASVSPVVATSRLGAGVYQGVLGTTPMVMEDAGPTGMPGMPLAGTKGMPEDDFSAPIYGFRPRVMPHPPAAG